MVGRIAESEALQFSGQPGRHWFAHVARGAVRVDGVALEAGDALMSSGEAGVRFEAVDRAEILLFDLA